MLVVDDGDMNRKLIRLVLERAGAQVEQAENGKEAVERTLAEPFDLILMDMQMPVMDGYAATRELRARGVAIPIIALTANAMKGDEARCREAGCSGYLAKPIDLDFLLTTIAETVSNFENGVPACGVLSGRIRRQIPRKTALAHRLPCPLTGNGLVSTLPMDDGDFREIVLQFRRRLDEKLDAMQTVRALAAGYYRRAGRAACIG